MENGEILFLNKLVNSLIESYEQLEKANAKKDYEAFNKFKRIMLTIQKEISGILK